MAASIGGDHQSLSATLLLGTLTLVLGHSLLDEIKRQARRVSPGWARSDTTNAVLLGVWAELSLLASILLFHTSATRAVGLMLAVTYAAACGYFVTERRRAISEATPATVEEFQPTTVDAGTVSPPTSDSARPDIDSAGADPHSIKPGPASNRTSPVSERPSPVSDRPSPVSDRPDGAVPHRRHGGHAPTAGHGRADHRPPGGPTLTAHPMSHGPGRSVAHAPAAHILADAEAAEATSAA